jgi:hypothetical protein
MMGIDNKDVIREIIDDTMAPLKTVASEIKNMEPDSNAVIDANNKNDDTDVDYNFIRGNLKELVDKGNEALDGILELAQESEHPRAYEVVGQLIKTLADANKDIMDLQKNVKSVKGISGKGPNKVTNALFVGSTHDLQKMIKQESSKD